MKILHVLQSPRAEGTVRIALDWLAEPGPKQEVFVLCPHPAELVDELRTRASWYEEGHDYPEGRSKFIWMVREVRRVCRQRRPDLVICWTNGFSPWVLWGARVGGVRRLITHAGNPPNWGFLGRSSTILSTATAWATGARMVCCSHYVANEFRRSPGAFRSVLRPIHNCAPVPAIRTVAARARATRRDPRPKLIMVATLEGHKDHATLLRAMPSVAGAFPDVQLMLAGDGSLRGALESLTEVLGVGNSVAFLGSRSDIPSLLGNSDLFVFATTRAEGLGTVLIEALAAGLPVIASDVPACREALAEGRWGTLVPPGDHEALANAVISRLRQPAIAETSEFRAYLDAFSPANMIAAYLAV